MRLSDLDMLQLIPTFMRRDGTAIGISEGINEVIGDVAGQLPILTKWNQIDNMDHDLLDELAWELNVLWYDPGASLETKRRLIKNSDMVYARLGTKWAVEEIAASYFGDGVQVLEWWEYPDGRPHYFKIVYSNDSVTAEDEERFFNALEKVKRKSQWLEHVVRESFIRSPIYVAGRSNIHYKQEIPLPSFPMPSPPEAVVGLCGRVHIYYRQQIGGIENFG